MLCTCIFHFWTSRRRYRSLRHVSMHMLEMFNFVFLSLKCWFQFNSRIAGTHFAETGSYIFRWRSRCRWRRLCLSSLLTKAKSTRAWQNCIFNEQKQWIRHALHATLLHFFYSNKYFCRALWNNDESWLNLNARVSVRVLGLRFRFITGLWTRSKKDSPWRTSPRGDVLSLPGLASGTIMLKLILPLLCSFLK